MNYDKVFFWASLASIVISIAIWCGVWPGVEPGLSKITGIFVGLWAPTLMVLSNRCKANCNS